MAKTFDQEINSIFSAYDDRAAIVKEATQQERDNLVKSLTEFMHKMRVAILPTFTELHENTAVMLSCVETDTEEDAEGCRVTLIVVTNRRTTLTYAADVRRRQVAISKCDPDRPLTQPHRFVEIKDISVDSVRADVTAFLREVLEPQR